MFSGESRSSSRPLFAVLGAVALAILLVACSSAATQEQTQGTDQPPGSDPALLAENASFEEEPPILEIPKVDGRRDPALRVRPVRHPARARTTSRTAARTSPSPTSTAGSSASARTSTTPTAPSRRVDVIHLHHGVWLNRSAKDPTAPALPERFFAAGEEKTSMTLPPGYGYPYKADRQLAPQLHDPQPHARPPTRCGSPTTSTSSPRPSPAAQGIKPARPIWMDVAERRDLPGVRRAQGRGHRRHVHVPRRRHRPVRRRPAEERVDGRPRRRARRHRRPPAPRRAARRPLRSPGPAPAAPSRRAELGEGDTAHLFTSKATTTSPRARCRGTWR